MEWSANVRRDLRLHRASERQRRLVSLGIVPVDCQPRGADDYDCVATTDGTCKFELLATVDGQRRYASLYVVCERRSAPGLTFSAAGIWSGTPSARGDVQCHRSELRTQPARNFNVDRVPVEHKSARGKRRVGRQQRQFRREDCRLPRAHGWRFMEAILAPAGDSRLWNLADRNRQRQPATHQSGWHIGDSEWQGGLG